MLGLAEAFDASMRPSEVVQATLSVLISQGDPLLSNNERLNETSSGEWHHAVLPLKSLSAEMGAVDDI